MSGEWLTVGEAAERLRVSTQAVRRAADNGQLIAGRSPGGHRRIKATSVERLRAELYPDEDSTPEVEGPAT